jgi:hypothetical protein
MAQCEVCGNDYYLSFEVITAGNRHVFDCFECAIHRLAPVCAHCSVKIIGHGIEAKENFFCCANCAKHVEGGHIKLTRNDSPDGQHHFVSLDTVESVDGETVRLRQSGKEIRNSQESEGDSLTATV